MKHKHDPKLVFPSRRLIGDIALQFSLALRVDQFYVICPICGMIGSQINSRRGGIRWHTSPRENERDEILLAAKNYWSEAGSIPDYITKYLPPC